MSALNTTPGPWHLYQHFATPMPDRFDVVGATRDDDIADNVTKANAHLIAAAPDLYEALSAMIAWANSGGSGGGYPGSQAASALAKARGETA